MTFDATVVDPLTGPSPAGWDAFAAAHRLKPGWFAGPIRAINWCVPVASSMVMVQQPGAPEPVGLFHARHFGPGDPARFVQPGRRPRLGLTECRTVPVPRDAGLAFAPDTDARDRAEAVRTFERTLLRRTGAGNAAIVYYNVLAEQLPAVAGPGRWLRRVPSRMVLHNEWPDLASYLASLSKKWRWQMKKIRQEVEADESVRVELSDTIDPVEACWLAEVVRLRHTPRWPPRPLLSAHSIAQVAGVPGARFLTYRDAGGRMLGYSAVHDNGTDLHLIWWGTRGGADGWRENLYFDQYLRLAQLMIDTGRQRLILGPGMARIKARYGARPEPRWSVIGVATTGGGGRPRRYAVGSAGEPVSAEVGPARSPAGGSGHRMVGWLLRWVGRDPRRGELTACCRQCGQWASVNVLRSGRRGARYWCERCGAVVSLVGRSQLGALQPVGRMRQAAGPGSAAVAGYAVEADLREFMPPAMVRWVRERYRKPNRADPRERSVVYQRYRQWDAHLGRLGREAAAGLAADGESPPCPGLPAFSRVVGALHDGCYQVEQVAEQLRASGEVPADVPPEALRERVEHARRWLARHGRSLCWVHGQEPDGGLIEPDGGQVRAALVELRAGRMPGVDGGRAVHGALFGTGRGPGLPMVLRVYGSEAVIAALDAYLASGARPLRDDVLARLA